MKTPISYYGGKQSMLNLILPLIPEHSIYIEPFFGGGSVFWAKNPARIEIINDYSAMVINFYEQLKVNFVDLKLKIDSTVHSRDMYKSAITIYNNPYIFSPISRAWAFWVCTNMGFNNIAGSWRCGGLTNKVEKLIYNKKCTFSESLSKRLDLVRIENMDAVQLIKQYDSKDAFFFIDPPYVGANQGHYGGYTQSHFDCLIEALMVIKGRFMLTTYPNEQLRSKIEKLGWTCREFNLPNTGSSLSGKRKTEVVTMNYAL